MEQVSMTGIVLGATPIGENDRRIVLLTRERGKISAFARNARRQNSPLLSAATPMAFGEFSVIEGRTSNRVTGAQISNYFPGIREDLVLVYYGYYLLEVAEYYGHEYNDERELLKLLYQSLRALESGKFSPEFVRRVYEWKLLAIGGVYPDVTEEGFRRRYHLSQSGEYALQFIIGSSIGKLFTFQVSDCVMEEISYCVEDVFSHSVDRRFKSLEMLEMMRKGSHFL